MCNSFYRWICEWCVYKLNSQLTCSHGGFIAQSVEHRTGIAEVMGSNPIEASDFFLGFVCNCLSYFKTAKITFTSILYPQFTYINNNDNNNNNNKKHLNASHWMNMKISIHFRNFYHVFAVVAWLKIVTLMSMWVVRMSGIPLYPTYCKMLT